MHETICEKLLSYVHNVPNIMFHGPSGSGKKYLMRWFLDRLYPKERHVMMFNCTGKGIKYIRDNVKVFAKTHANTPFKTVVMLNAENLSSDAQSALRRCIEQYSASTRFFIVTCNKHRILSPILSRFCEIYVPLVVNMHKSTISKAYHLGKYDSGRPALFRRLMTEESPIVLASRLSDHAFTALDLAAYVEMSDVDPTWKYTWLMMYHKLCPEFRNEQLLLYALLSLYFRKDPTIKLFM